MGFDILRISQSSHVYQKPSSKERPLGVYYTALLSSHSDSLSLFVYIYIGVGFSALLVSIDRAMREPLGCGTGTALTPRFSNGYDKFTEFAFILKNNNTKERKCAIYSFNEETEAPIYLYEEDAPEEGQIKEIIYRARTKGYSIIYTNNNRKMSEEVETPTPEADFTPPPPAEEPIIPIVEDEEESVADTTLAPAAEPVETTEQVEDNTIYNVAEEQPAFPGGEAAMMNFISNNIRYPSFCQESGIQGRVVVSFVINKDGSVVDVETKQAPHELLAKEAVRVVRSMPKWKPGIQKGKAVRVRYSFPIFFRLS